MNASSGGFGAVFGHDSGGRRPLQRQQRAIVYGRERHALRQAGRHMRVVGILAGGVYDEHQPAIIFGERPSG